MFPSRDSRYAAARWATFLVLATNANIFGLPLDLKDLSIDCGGATQATAGTTSLSVTVGQAEAAPVTLTGGTLSMTLGFLPVAQAELSALPCDADANGDETVDPFDAGFVLARLGCSVGTGDSGCDAADVNNDNIVDPMDAGFVLSRFGHCP